MDDEEDEYTVSPGRPPREHQFKKGKSGNPLGRPKGSLNLKTIYLEELSTPVGVKNKDSIHMLRAIVRQQTRMAAKGRHAAIESVLNRAERYQASSRNGQSELPAEDEAILRRFGYFDGAAVSDQEGLTNEDKEDDEGFSDE